MQIMNYDFYGLVDRHFHGKYLLSAGARKRVDYRDFIHNECLYDPSRGSSSDEPAIQSLVTRSSLDGSHPSTSQAAISPVSHGVQDPDETIAGAVSDTCRSEASADEVASLRGEDGVTEEELYGFEGMRSPHSLATSNRADPSYEASSHDASGSNNDDDSDDDSLGQAAKEEMAISSPWISPMAPSNLARALSPDHSSLRSDEQLQALGDDISHRTGKEPVVDSVATMRLQPTPSVAVGSSGHPEPELDSRRPLKRRLDLPLQVATPSDHPLDGASCAMQSTALAPALNTTPQSKNLNKRGKPIIAFVSKNDVFIDLSDDDDNDPTQEWFVVNTEVNESGQVVKKELVPVVANPSIDLLDNAAGVAPPPDAIPVKIEKHFQEHQKLRAEQARVLEDSRIVMEWVALNPGKPVPERICDLVRRNVNSAVFSTSGTVSEERSADYPRPGDNSVPSTIAVPPNQVEDVPATSATASQDYPWDGDNAIDIRPTQTPQEGTVEAVQQPDHPQIGADEGLQGLSAPPPPAEPQEVGKGRHADAHYPRPEDNAASTSNQALSTASEDVVECTPTLVVVLPIAEASLPPETGLELSQYDQMVIYPRPGDNPEPTEEEVDIERQQGVDEAPSEALPVPVPVADSLPAEQECVNSPDHSHTEGAEEELVDYSESPSDANRQEGQQASVS